MARLAGKVAVITGAAAGTGRAIALRFAEEGCDLAITDLSLAGLEETAQMAELHGVRIVATRTEVAERADVEALVAEAVTHLGPLDILVNNTRSLTNTAFDKLTDEQWQGVLNSNLTGVFLLSQTVVRHWLAAQRGGAIVNLVSDTSGHALARSAHACTAGGGIVALSRCIALEYGPRGIRSNCLAPGIIETAPAPPALADPAARADWLRRIPLQRLGQPADVADAAVFLASDESRYITGDVLHVDGGWLIG